MNNDTKNFNLWLYFFLYTSFVSAVVQFIILPYVLPFFYAGRGLLHSSYDSIWFDRMALEMVDQMRIHGWSAWHLKPFGQAPIGIAAIFYFLIWPDQRVLILLYAALHATAALLLTNMIYSFVKDKLKAVLCVLPFLMFPSNLLWTAQLHKDGFSILGVFLILQSTILLMAANERKFRDCLYLCLLSIFLCICGIFMNWIVRPYMVALMKFFVEIIFSVMIPVLLIKAFARLVPWPRALLISLFMFLMIFVLSQVRTDFEHVDSKNKFLLPFVDAMERSIAPQSAAIAAKGEDRGYKDVPHQPAFAKPFIPSYNRDDQKPKAKKTVKPEGQPRAPAVDDRWNKTSWLPSFIDNKAYSIARLRKGWRVTSPEAKSNIDHEVGFGSIKDILNYLPRALQIAFLAPFPNQWFAKGSAPANYMMRIMAMPEMLIVYFTLIFLPYTIWRWRKSIEMWTVFLFCMYMMVNYGLIVCNIGSLYRMRYPYITTVVALGMAGFIALLERLGPKKDL